MIAFLNYIILIFLCHACHERLQQIILVEEACRVDGEVQEERHILSLVLTEDRNLIQEVVAFHNH